MTSGIAGCLQWLMRSSLIPWTRLILLTNFRLIIVPGTKIQKVTTMASHGTKKGTAKSWQNGDNRSWQNKDKKSWQNNNKNKSDKPRDTCFTLSQDQKFFVPADCDENTFQTICTLVKAQIDRAKQSSGNSKEINEISKDTLVNLLNISDETYNAAQAAIQQVAKDDISSSSSLTD